MSINDGPGVVRIGPAARAMLTKGIAPPYVPATRRPLTGRTHTGHWSDQFRVDRSSRRWSDRNLYWAQWYASTLEADGIYWDQLSCIGGGLRETAWNLARITDAARKIRPGFISAGEGVGQAHGRRLDLGLASAVFHRTELYRYTFPRHLVLDGTRVPAVKFFREGPSLIDMGVAPPPPGEDGKDASKTRPGK